MALSGRKPFVKNQAGQSFERPVGSHIGTKLVESIPWRVSALIASRGVAT